ncbi:hypothetical protein SAMN05443636_1583 [Halobaculum gomorrense]|uniref:Uncharacterized protein n=2 Tax=Halobaculum gomorrense TaxID=43928 RepID=A0A1M5PFR6_9EURY|nr:hypothetical protein SAMN05443636_1583 [Halobaculum gomorrense]
MFKAELTKIEAKSLGSTFSSDDLIIVFHIDGGDDRDPYFIDGLEFSSTGDTWDLSRGHPYNTQVAITLYEDDIDSDNEIDTVEITDTSATTSTLTITDGDAEYEIDYEVTDEGSTTAAEIAHQDFVDSNRPGVWSKIKKTDLTTNLDLFATPPADQDGDGTPDAFQLDQGTLGYCSNIAVAFSVLWRQPRRFIELVRAIYEDGEFLSRTDEQSISSELLDSPVPSGIDSLEWLVSATMEDADNWIDSVTADDKQAGAYNEFEQYWLDELAGYDNTSITDDDAGEATVRNKSNTALNNGGTAILGIHADMVRAPPAGFRNSPGGKSANQMVLNHAVTLTGNFQTTGANTQYTIHTWGSQVQINHPTNILNNYLYDTVAGSD